MSAARRSTIRLTGVAALAALTVGLLAGCTSGGGSAASSGSRSSSGGGGGAVAFQSSEGRSAAGASPADAKGGTATVDRAIVRTGNLDLTAKDPVRTAEAITTIVTGSGGHIDTVSEDPTGDASSQLTARIPSDVFDRTLTAIKHQGTVRTVSVRATDVTSQVTDVAVRIKGLDTSIARLQTLLAKAGTTTALVEIESSLTTRETDREQLLAQQKALKDQVSYATLSISVHEPSLARNAPPSTFLSGLAAGWQTLVAVGASVIVGIGVLLPWALALAVLGLIALAIIRLVRRIRRRAATPA
jgi:hypothetical protein